jgi:hypothetical protein
LIIIGKNLFTSKDRKLFASKEKLFGAGGLSPGLLDKVWIFVVRLGIDPYF